MEKIVLETVQWKTLKDIDDIEPIGEKDFLVLREIGDVLRKHDYADRFGMCLLHKHFDLKENERLVEETDCESRISTIKAEQDDRNEKNMIQTMWKFSNSIESVTVCVLRCHNDNGHKQRHKIESR